MINTIIRWFKKKPLRINLGRVGIIYSTQKAVESGINDKFNKIIVIYSSLRVVGDRIRFGRIIEEIPYLEEEARNLERIKKIPIVEKRLINRFKFKLGSPFGEVLT